MGVFEYAVLAQAYDKMIDRTEAAAAGSFHPPNGTYSKRL